MLLPNPDHFLMALTEVRQLKKRRFENKVRQGLNSSYLTLFSSLTYFWLFFTAKRGALIAYFETH